MNTIDAAYRSFCTKHFPLPNDAQLAEVESRIGVRMPEDFRQFVLNHNGGFFNDPEIIAKSEGCPKDWLEVLYGLNASVPSLELASDRSMNLFSDNYPAKLVPIGYTSTGNSLLVKADPESDDRGTILLKRAMSQDYYAIASTIQGFFELLHPT